MEYRFRPIDLVMICLLVLLHLPARGVEPGKATSIHHVVAANDLKMARLILKADPTLVNQKGPDGWTPLMFAARFGKMAMVELILSYKPDLNLKDRDGYTALHQAAAYGHEDIIRLLLDKGAQVNPRTEGRVTPRRLAKSNGHFRCANLLKDHGGFE